MTVNVRLTRRDLDILLDCYKNIFLSFTQIKRKHFFKNAETTAYNRLSILVRGGYLNTHKTHSNAYFFANGSVGTVFQVTKKALSVLSYMFLEENIGKSIPKINKNSFEHDLVLTDVLRGLRLRYDRAKIENTRILGEKYRSGTQVPDAVLFNGDDQYAIELELTQKESSRYRDIVLNYHVDDRYKRIIYIAKAKTISSQIRQQLDLLGPVVNEYGHKLKFFTIEELADYDPRVPAQIIYKDPNKKEEELLPDVRREDYV